MDDPFFSILVPAYNAKKTVARLVDSLRRQSFPDFEVLIADDGSTDGTPEEVARAAAGDPRFSVLKLEHRGTAAWGRNSGLKQARGRYVVFVDSDDFLDADALACLEESAKSHRFPEVLAISMRTVDSETLAPRNVIGNGWNAPGVIPGKQALEACGRNFCGYSMLNVCLRSFLLKHHLFQDESIFMLEDMEWSWRVYYFASGILRIEKPFYNYARHSGNATERYTSRTLADVVKSIEKQTAFFGEHRDEMTAELRSVMANRILSTGWMFFLFPSSVAKSGKERFDEFRSWRNYPVLRADVSRIKKTILAVQPLCRFKLFFRLFGLFFRVVYYPVCCRS